ncbi:MAG TPA: diaminopimelate epimerase [Gemmatimonadales bacterium]|nr:diaminopimelate epimerase [Gemmatimonadales bacterium]
MSGSGNDFVMLDGRATTPGQWPTSQVRAICDRRNGVGADGLVILTPEARDLVRMTYWNSDGSIGALCGNAALCSARLALDLEFVQPGEFGLITDAGTVRVRSLKEAKGVEIKLPDFDEPRSFTAIGLGTGEHWMSLGTVGVPHLVIRVDDTEAVDPVVRGRPLRFDPAVGPDGANVNFISHPGGPEPWLIRTYERGVEGETLACGTGTVAASAAIVARGEASLPIRFRSRGGQELSVRGSVSNGRVSGCWLAGGTQLVFKGVWEGT